MNTTHDTDDRRTESQSVAPEVGSQCRLDPRCLFAGVVGDGRRAGLLDGDHDLHRFTEFFASGFAAVVTDDAVESLDEVVIGADPHADAGPGFIGHGESWNLQGLGYCATGGVVGA